MRAAAEHTELSFDAQNSQSESSAAEKEHINQEEEEEEGTPDKPKRRRVSKIPDKKYTCPHNGCGKIYSRAEHLYRHQLNHTPKQIYECDHPGCDRRFVRQDLCSRHKERHVAKKPGLMRKTKSKYDIDIVVSPKLQISPGKARSARDSNGRRDSTLAPTNPPYTQHGLDPSTRSHESQIDPGQPLPNGQYENTMPLDPRLASNSSFYSPAGSDHRPVDGHQDLNHPDLDNTMHGPPGITHAGAGGYPHGPIMSRNGGMALAHTPFQDSQASYQGDSRLPQFLPSSVSSYVLPVSPERQNRFVTSHPQMYGDKPAAIDHQYQVGAHDHTSIGRSYVSMAQLPGFDNLPLSQSPHTGPLSSASVMSPHSIPKSSFSVPPVRPPSLPPTPIQHDSHSAHAMPVFNNEFYSLAPFTSTDDFTSWLFNNDPSLMASPHASGLGVGDHSYSAFPFSDMGSSGGFNLPTHDRFSEPRLVSSMPVTTGCPEAVISEKRRQRLMTMIVEDFHDRQHAFVTEQRASVLAGNHNETPHVLSLPMMELYLTSFWTHVHQQMPILHKPTFATETCPDLLLIPLMALGASNLDRSRPYEMRQASSDLSFFLAWHARYKLYQEVDFGPPAKLWIFQALLLLEIFEKMYSTRSLHERAHIHHCTTLTLMRRGSSLIGRSAVDFPPFSDDPTRTPPGPNGSINTSGYNTPDEEWNLWISAEATRRTAFAAFIIDTTHATMFAHSAVMVAHEMRILLPCDESLWSAPSMSEVQRIRHTLEAQDVKPVTFLEALKKTLNGQPVRTNTFGRVTVMAGLLSVSWHMKMQDVRVNSVGVGKQGSWGRQLLYAFDFWKRDFDASLSRSHEIYYRSHPGVEGGLDHDNVFESRTVLHHLAHIAMHCDVLDCQMFAGAKRLLGRVIPTQEQEVALRRMRETWAPSARARDATFYALRFLSEVLVPEDHVSSGTPHHVSSGFDYSAREDHLLNRPWVLYIATLVVWSYGYALDGPIAPPTYTLTSRENKVHDMQGFLRRVGGVKSPEELAKIKDRNSCLGLLMLLRDMFRNTRWELLHEGSALLGNCIEMLMPGISDT